MVSCWGGSSAGQLAIPSLPAGMVAAVAAGGDSSCAVLAEGSLRCWGGGLGSGLPAELGPGDVLMSVLPRRLQPVSVPQFVLPTGVRWAAPWMCGCG